MVQPPPAGATAPRGGLTFPNSAYGFKASWGRTLNCPGRNTNQVTAPTLRGAGGGLPKRASGLRVGSAPRIFPSPGF